MQNVRLPLPPEFAALIRRRRRRIRWIVVPLLILDYLGALFMGGITGGWFGFAVTAASCVLMCALCIRVCLLGKRRYERVAAVLGLLCLVALLAGAFLGFGDFGSHSFQMEQILWPVLIVFPVFGIPMIFVGDDLKTSQDIREGVYCRTSGPVTLDEDVDSYAFCIGDERFPVARYSALNSAFKSTNWASVDHSVSGRTVFEVRDHDGRILYSKVRPLA